jgi:hypothetical protein
MMYMIDNTFKNKEINTIRLPVHIPLHLTFCLARPNPGFNPYVVGIMLF